MRRKLIAVAGVCVAAILLIVVWRWRTRTDDALQSALSGIVSDYRKIIVLMDGADSLDDSLRARCAATGQVLFWHKQQLLDDVTRKLTEGSGREARARQLVRYVSEERSLHDADRLAFLDLVDELADARAPGARALLDNLQSIQLAYREEVTRIFSQFATRGASG